MATPRISIIAALGARSRAIGRANGLLWKIPGDLPRFRALTSGHPVIMGRKTFESIGKALPNRTNIIITQNPNLKVADCQMANSIDEALKLAKEAPGSDEIFVIGGGEIYKQAISQSDRLYLTLVDEKDNVTTEADTFFPDYLAFTKVVSNEKSPASTDDLSFSYLILER